MLVYKVLRQDELSAFLTEGETAGSAADRADGYVHLSTAAQIEGTLARHFRDADLLSLLACETETLGGDLRWETARTDQLFPHLYRHLRRDDVVWIRPIGLTAGHHVLPDGVA